MMPVELPPVAAHRRRLTDPDLLLAGAALLRSSRRALELAQKTGTPCYVWQDGRIINIGAPAAASSPAGSTPTG
jgi:hypothetical protein